VLAPAIALDACSPPARYAAAMINPYGITLDSASVRWAAAEGVSETIITAVLLLHERSLEEIVAKLRPGELEQVIKLVGRSPRVYPPGTLDTLKQRKALISPPPSDSVPSDISAKKQAWRPQHTADWPRRRHARTPAGLGANASQSASKRGNGAGPPQNTEGKTRTGKRRALSGVTGALGTGATGSPALSALSTCVWR
jgi:hypothetical protein